MSSNGGQFAASSSRAPSSRSLFMDGNERGGPWGSGYDVTPDGEGFLMVKASAPPPAPTQFKVVLNWFAELERRVPTKR